VKVKVVNLVSQTQNQTNIGWIKNLKMGANVLFILSLLACIVEAEVQYKIFNVMTYNASSNGNTDNSLVTFNVHSFSFVSFNLFPFLRIAILI